jgi:hypothetical protein
MRIGFIEKNMEIEIIEYRKAREGLTLPGIVAHITSAILLWNRGKGHGTQNDCQMSINHLLRAYHHLKLKKGLYGQVPATPAGRAAHTAGSGYHLEHAIPIACVMWALFNNVTQRDFDQAYDQVQKVIDDTMYVAYVTHDEHAKLNRRFASSMPPGSKYPWPDPWVRYKKAEVESPS